MKAKEGFGLVQRFRGDDGEGDRASDFGFLNVSFVDGNEFF